MPLSFSTDESAKKLKRLSIGHIEFAEVKNEKSNEVVDSVVDGAIALAKKKHPDMDSLLSDKIIAGMRSLLSDAGLDSSKTRPSGEALARRIVKGKGIYRINAVVDVNNSISLITGFPCGVYDLEKLEGNEIKITIGKPGQGYVNLQGEPSSANGKILTADSRSPFGGPAADSRRTGITLDTESVLMLIYAPPDSPEDLLRGTMDKATAFMEKAAGARKISSGIYRTG
ncbi:hypothetical protein GF318_04885 [Candidatus Micrarchaeota archaeon]|nr:hypothetical protein [Candidatus Micrarchaeota archaeon]